MVLMAVKSFDKDTFKSGDALGLRINTFSEMKDKLSIGIRMGGGNLSTILIGFYAVKYTNIPLYLTFRRMTVVLTITVNYLVKGEVPTTTLVSCAALITLGAIVAGYETIDSDGFGYFLVISTNLSQALYQVVLSKVNEGTGKYKISVFENNFCSALVGIPAMFAVLNYQGELNNFVNSILNAD